MKKLLFIDTNIFISCIYKEIENLDIKPLKDVLKKLKQDELILIMPEIIEKEIYYTLDKNFSDYKKQLIDDFKNLIEKKGSERGSHLIKDVLKESQTNCLSKVNEAMEEGKKIVKEIILQKNTKKVPLENELIMKGIRRSIFKIPPFTDNRDKPQHTTNQDCFAFESVLKFLEDKTYKKYTLVACINDADYYLNKEDDTLKKAIEDDLKKYIKYIKSYKNPLEMLKKEFSAGYSKIDIDKFSTVSINSPFIQNDSEINGATFYSNFNELRKNVANLSVTVPLSTNPNFLNSRTELNNAYFSIGPDTFPTPTAVSSDICTSCGFYKGALSYCINCRKNI